MGACIRAKTVLINYSILETSGNFISMSAGKVIAWNAAGKAAKTAVDVNWFLCQIER